MFNRAFSAIGYINQTLSRPTDPISNENESNDSAHSSDYEIIDEYPEGNSFKLETSQILEKAPNSTRNTSSNFEVNKDQTIKEQEPGSDESKKEVKKNEEFQFGESVNSSALFNPPCDGCKEKTDTKAFLCNHNLCTKCISNECYKQMLLFFENYQRDSEYINKGFSYKCFVKDCSKDISVPTMMILKNKNIQINPAFEYFISYLDGLIIHK